MINSQTFERSSKPITIRFNKNMFRRRLSGKHVETWNRVIGDKGDLRDCPKMKPIYDLLMNWRDSRADERPNLQVISTDAYFKVKLASRDKEDWLLHNLIDYAADQGCDLVINKTEGINEQA